MNNNKKAHFSAALVMVIWGISYLSIKVVVNEIEPTLSAFYRFLIAAIILFIILKLRFPEEKVLKEDRFKMVLGGFFGVSLYFFFENYSVHFTTPSNVAILISSIPVFTLISQRILFKEKLTILKIIGSFFSVIGIVIIITSKEKISLFSTGTLGDLMALGCALCWVIYNIINSRFKGNYKSITITTYQAIYGAVMLSPSLFFAPLVMPSVKVSINLLYLSIFCSCIGYVLYIYALEHLGATVLTTYINLQPIISLAAAFILMGEQISFLQLSGSVVIIIGIFMVSVENKLNKK